MFHTISNNIDNTNTNTNTNTITNTNTNTNTNNSSNRHKLYVNKIYHGYNANTNIMTVNVMS